MYQRRIICLFAALLIICLMTNEDAWCQTEDYWTKALHREKLAEPYEAETTVHTSYARDGSNEDYYSFVGVDSDGWNILCNDEGPGVVSHMWCTFNGVSHLRLYIDDMENPIIDTTVTAFFGGIDPFVPPLARTINFARSSYVPIPFNERIKITTDNNTFYHEVIVHKFPQDCTIASFSLPPPAEYTARLDSLINQFENCTRPVFPNEAALQNSGSAVIQPGETAEVLSVSASGICRRLLLLLDSQLQTDLENIWIDIYVDNYSLPQLYGPVCSLFGAALGWRPYSSTILGMSGDSLYINAPIPFRSSLRVEATNLTESSRTVLSAMEVVEREPLNLPPYRLTANYAESRPTRLWTPHRACDIEDGGSFLGLFWEFQDSEHRVLEGDPRMRRDNEPEYFFNGTGTEDFFNGAFYWTNESGAVEPYQLPAHGVLYLGGGTGAAYRWFYSYPLAFRDRFEIDMEVSAYGQIVGNYRTTAWAYHRIPRWTILDNSGNQASSAGEEIRIVGYGLPAGQTVSGVRLDDIVLTHLSGNSVVTEDSVFDATYLAPTEGTGLYDLIVTLGSQTETIVEDWPHSSVPTISFLPLRLDPDSLVFAVDTLLVTIHGLEPGTSGTVSIEGTTLPWITMSPFANEYGVLEAHVMVPSGIDEGDYPLELTTASYPVVESEQLLKYRTFFRIEIELLELVSRQCRYYRDHYALHFTHPDSTYPWGRNILQFADSEQEGDSVVYRFSIPDSGVFRISYFFAGNQQNAVVEARIDEETDAIVDTYMSGLGWRIARLDTVYGQPRVLTRGDHLLTFRTHDRNEQSFGYDMWMDQIVIKKYPSFPPSFEWLSLQENDTAWMQYTLTWSAEDPDNDALIDLFAVASTFDTIDINTVPVHEDETESYELNVEEFEEGWYQIGATITDGFTPSTVMAPGSLLVTGLLLGSSDDSLAFGNTRVDSSHTLTLSLSNPGIAPVTVEDVTVSSDYYAIELQEALNRSLPKTITRKQHPVTYKKLLAKRQPAQTKQNHFAKSSKRTHESHTLDEISFQLNPGETRLLSVAFSPTAEGELRDTLRVFSDATIVEIPLSGYGAYPNLLALPVIVDFQNVHTDSSEQRILEIGNSGSWDAVIQSISLESESPFIVTGIPEVPYTLEVDGVIELQLEFSPENIGTFEDTLMVVYDDEHTVEVSLSGIGVQEAISHSPDTLSFSPLLVDDADTLLLTVSNPGTATLFIHDVISSNDVFALLPLSMNEPATVSMKLDRKQTSRNRHHTLDEVSFEVEPGGSQDLLVRFSPSEGVEYSGELIFYSDLPNDTIVLNGTGVILELTTEPVSIDFGEAIQLTTEEHELVMHNPTPLPIVFEEFSFVVSDMFTVVTDFPDTLLPNDSDTISIGFTPLEAGLFFDAFLIDYGALLPLEIALAGEGILPPLEINPQQLDFDSVWIDSTLLDSILLINSGDLDIQIDSVYSSTAEFVPSVIEQITISPTETLTVEVRFQPADTLSYSGILHVASHSIDFSLELDGQGIWTELTVDPEILSFPILTHMTSADTLEVVLSNIGNTEITGISASLQLGTHFQITGLVPNSIPAYSSEHLEVVAAADSIGLFADTLSITDDLGSNLLVAVRVEVISPAGELPEMPIEYFLSANFPNPFNARTSITFDVPTTGIVSLRVYNTLGQIVAILKDGMTEPGRHVVAFDGSELSSGLYFCRMTAGDFNAIQKMVLMK